METGVVRELMFTTPKKKHLTFKACSYACRAQLFMGTQYLYPSRSPLCRWDEPATPPLRGHFSRPQSVHMMSSRCVRKPRPTSVTEHRLQLKHSLCHWRSSNEMYLAPARPARTEQRGTHLTQRADECEKRENRATD